MPLTFRIKNKIINSIRQDLTKPELFYRLYCHAAYDYQGGTMISGATVRAIAEGQTQPTRSQVASLFSDRWCCGLFQKTPNLNFTTVKLGSDPMPREIYMDMSSDIIDLEKYMKKNEIDEKVLKLWLNPSDASFDQSLQRELDDMRQTTSHHC